LNQADFHLYQILNAISFAQTCREQIAMCEQSFFAQKPMDGTSIEVRHEKITRREIDAGDQIGHPAPNDKNRH
tara:strand:- start:1643 stop:1861 length:219 start_codon:yes stop_codon:yes gene_type:complete